MAKAMLLGYLLGMGIMLFCLAGSQQIGRISHHELQIFKSCRPPNSRYQFNPFSKRCALPGRVKRPATLMSDHVQSLKKSACEGSHWRKCDEACSPL